MKKLLTIILIITICCLPLTGCTKNTTSSGFIIDGITYEYGENTFYVIKKVDTSLSGEINISSVQNGSTVHYISKIETDAFKNCTKITSINISGYVQEIEYHAFFGCSSLTSVTIGSYVKKIGWGAFYGCSSLQKAYFNTSGQWYVSKNSFTNGSKIYLTDASSNAELLSTEKMFVMYNWYRN